MGVEAHWKFMFPSVMLVCATELIVDTIVGTRNGASVALYVPPDGADVRRAKSRPVMDISAVTSPPPDHWTLTPVKWQSRNTSQSWPPRERHTVKNGLVLAPVAV